MGSVEKPGIRNTWPVGFGFRPTEDELINHHLTRKLRGLEEAGRVIPELNIYQWEPQTLFETYNAMSDCPSDGGNCFFCCTRDGKNRKTPTRFWKETKKKRTFRGRDWEIGFKRIFVHKESYWRKSSFSMHEYHLNCCTNHTIRADQGPVKESECIDPDLVTLGSTAAIQGDKDKEASPHNLTEAEAEGGNGDGSGMELVQYKESIFNEHPHIDLFDGLVNSRDYCPEDGLFISELLD